MVYEKHSKETYSIHLIRERQDLYISYIHYKTCESNFADVPLTVVFNPVENNTTGSSSKKKNLEIF